MANLIDNVNQACADFANIKRAITYKGVPIADGTPTYEYASKINAVYNKGVEEGLSRGEDTGAYYNDFWDSVQENGTRTMYEKAFCGWTWDDITFQPKYDIVPTGSIASMFEECQITDLEAILNNLGVSFVTDDVDSFEYAFANSAISALPNITIGQWTYSVDGMCSYCSELVSISLLNFDGTNIDFNDAFEGCYSLENVSFGGTLISNLNMGDCPLNWSSVESLFGVLSDEVSGKTVKLNRTAVESNVPADEWQILLASKPDWKIDLVDEV